MVKRFKIQKDISHIIDDVKIIINIQNSIIHDDNQNYFIEFDGCSHFNAAVLVLIGTLMIYCNKLGKKLTLILPKMHQQLIRSITKIGIYDFFKNHSNYSVDFGGYTLPFGEISDEDMMEKYTDKIIKLAPILLSNEASAELTSIFFEIFQNSFIHSKSEIGVYSCGNWDNDYLIFSIYDMGTGIPDNVREHNSDFSKISFQDSIECVKWAFKKGNSTTEDAFIKRGLGLSRLKEFIEINGGIMTMYTDDVYYHISDGKSDFGTLNFPIKGTLIIIKIKPDFEHIYKKGDESHHA